MATEAPQHFEAEAAPNTSALPRTDSALRSSIAKYGANSYYYAHAPLPAASDDAKKIEGPGIVTGGPPTLLASGKAEQAQLLCAREAAVCAVEGRRVVGAVSLTRYTWCDGSKTVKVYIHLENIRPGEEAEGPFTTEQVAAEFGVDRAAVAIERPSGLYLLAILKTYGSINPNESSISVSENKITLSLQKKDDLTWFNLTR